MSIRTSRWPAGTPCWAGLNVPPTRGGPSSVHDFYAAVLGWSFADTAYGYQVAQVRGATAAALGAEEGSAAWTLYLAADDADATAKAVVEHGGTVTFEAGDVADAGRMFRAADPTGAAFGVWQAGTTIGAGIVNEPGGMVWEDLRSPDPDAARAFYSGVFGYRTEPLDAGMPGYTTFALPGDPAPLGGMGPMMGPPGDGQAPHWLVYFGVADAAAAVAAAPGAGGTVVAPAFDTPFGPMAGLRDPAGAVFWVGQTGTDDPAGRAG